MHAPRAPNLRTLATGSATSTEGIITTHLRIPIRVTRVPLARNRGGNGYRILARRENMWTLSNRCDPEARVIADRHYNRQSVGAKNFVPPGRCLVLKTPNAFWVTSWPFAEFVRHKWRGAWVCSAFRNEGQTQSSLMIKEALEETKKKWPEPPKVGTWIIVKRQHDRTLVEWDTIAMVTFVDTKKTKSKRDPRTVLP